MQSRTFTNIISSRLAPVRFGFDLCRGVASLAVLFALAVTSEVAQAQVYNPAPPTEQPSQKNPAPRAGGDAQNRNRAHDDKYWGATDANRRWFQIPYSRIPDPASVARGNGRLVADGWQFPRLANQDPARQGIDFGGGVAGTIPNGGLGGTSVRYFAAPWVTVTGPSTNALGDNGSTDNEYQRTPAVARLATAVPEDTIANAPSSSVKWFPNISGDVNTIRRFSIRIYLPTPEPFPTDGSLASETRVEDARYIVYFNRPRAANDPEPAGQRYVTRRRVILRSQSASGWFTLTDSNEQPLLFPMVTEATAVAENFTANQRPRVELDNTTAGDTGSRFIIADQIQFVPTSEYGEIKAPTTVTPIHGGRKVDAPAALGAPYDPAKPLFQQPAWTVEPRSNPYEPIANGPRGLINDSFEFINNPRDVTNAIYTDATQTNYQPFEPWNPSTLFQGPRSLIDDQTGVTINGTAYNNGVPPVLRTNQDRYEYNDGTFGIVARPLFSHMQVLVPRTEYVPDPNSVDGLGSIAVGCVYSVDWLTGTPIWRFPDRTFLPRRAVTGEPGTVGSYQDQYGNNVAQSGSRNPNTTIDGVVVPTVPGIGAYDKNLDGYISDDEVYIVGQGGNPSGGIDAGITIAPRILTRATNVDTTVPVYNDAWNPYASPTPGPGFTSANPNATSITDVVNVPIGRYSGPGVDANGFAAPVEAGIAFVAANNGVIYAIDPYGNNDNRYYNFQSAGTPDTTRFGTYRPGSTNAFWTFSVTAPVRGRTESNEDYNIRLKQSVPATGSWGRSSPVIAYAKEDGDATLNRFTQEPRLFVGNANGVLYAINAVADAGVLVQTPPPMPTLQYNLRPFPFRKEIHEEPNVSDQRPDLRWWFETQGPITASPAVSASVHPLTPADPTAKAKGVYVTSNDGRVYSLDWNGPVTKSNHNTNLNYTGLTAADRRLSAEELNDNFRFHNTNATSDFARADGTEGEIRPRWVFPSRYRDIDGNEDNSELAPIQPADESQVFPGYRVERQARLAPINSAPSLMDYPFRATPTGPTVIKRYVAVVANDLNGSDDPIRGRVYLLDQVGDRRDFSVKPVQRPGVAGNPNVAFGQPDDMYAPTEYVFSDATPAWTYRPVYKRYSDAGVTENRQLRNRPNQLTGANADLAANTNQAGAGLAEKRELPTLFVGGVQGRLFALDIDPQTGLFLRWREDIASTRAFVPLPDSFTAANVPVNEPLARRLDPPSPVLNAIAAGPTTLNARPPLVRTIQGLNAEDVSSIVISGGPQQNRNHPYATAAPVNGPTVPGLPTNDTPSLQYPGVPYILGAGAPIIPVTNVQPPYWNDINVNATTAGTALDLTPFPTVQVPSFDLVGRFVNQDHDDPAATTRGTYPNPLRTVVGQSLVTDTPEDNRAYQYPTLAVTMSNGLLSLVSTELDGLDSAASTVDSQGTEAEYELGWAYASDPVLGNDIRPLLMSFFGPGGPGTSVAIVTNANYGAMDPGFRNTVTKYGDFPTSPGTPLDPSRTNFPYYPWYEPLNQGLVDTSPYDDPRPRFEPRSLYSGNTANPNGPDGVPATGDGWPEIKADAHTGRTGFPLDLRGLFYDKRFAANTTNNNTNDDGLLRLPAYTGIGEALAVADRRLRTTQTTPFVAAADAAAIANGALYTPLADGTPDVARDSSTGATTPYRTDPFKLFAGAVDAGDPYIKPEADINPPGTNITWMFVGGSDGVFYSYTPNRYSVPGFGAGLGSGFVGGRDNNNPRLSEGTRGNPKIILISEATYNALSSSPGRPDPNTQNLLLTGKPFYEYGESIYAVVYDIGPDGPYVDTNDDGVLTEAGETLAGGGPAPVETRFPTTVNVAFRPTNGSGPTVLIAAPVSNFRYPYDAATQSDRPVDPSNLNQPVSRRAIALLRIQVNTNSNAGGVNGGRRVNLARNAATSGIGWTPGAVYEIGLNENAGASVAPSSALALRNLRPLVTIANPIAIQAFLLSSEEGNLATVADPINSNRIYNNIGPFLSDNGSAGAGSVKNKVATSALLTAANQQNYDPDRDLAEYNQALANGNRVTRVDLNPYGATPGTTRNVNYGKPLISSATGSGIEATYEPTFYLPVAASAGMINHGKPGSTDVSNNRRTLRIVNRSLQGSLGKVRVELRSDALFQQWPGIRPNVRAIDGPPTANGVGTVGTGNPRLTPAFAAGQAGDPYRMRPDGIINYLPWEQPLVTSLPWEREGATTGLGVANTSRDYPDIAAQSEAASNQKVVSVVNESGDLTQSSGVLKASIGTTNNISVLDTAIRDWTATGGGNFQSAAAAVNITVPLFQPANLVAMHSLTSTYVKPSADEAPGDGILDGEIQLPRTTATGSGLDRAFNDRGLRLSTTSATGTGARHTVTPMGYTLQMRAYIDVNGDGTWDATEPYREFETWFGVPVDVTLKQNGGTTELPGANGPAFAHGMGQQNGYLGYGQPGVGFLPPFLQDSNVANLGDPYSNFFKPFAVRSESNINLWNVRASQKIEQFNPLPTTGNPAGDGDLYQYFAMQSTGIDPRFGILSVESDPTAAGYNPTGIMPNVVTSLDRRFDAAWNNQFAAPTPSGQTNLFGLSYNPLRIPVPTPNGLKTRYELYYQAFGGRHTLHKPTPGAPVGSGTLLSVPDVPAGSLPTTLSPGPIGADLFPAAGQFLPPIEAKSPYLGVAVPLGTPSGRYSNSVSGTPLAFFEDHDTTGLALPVTAANQGYRTLSVPDLNATSNNSLRLVPAGPLYGDQNFLHPGRLQQLGVNPILPASGEGILRPRRIIGIDNNNTTATTADDAPIYEYLPSTTVTTSQGRTAFEIVVNVKEAPLTGQIADQALTAAGFTPSIVNGVLPAIDNAPLFDFTNVAAGNTARPVSSLAPAAYRTADGNLVLFHNSNAYIDPMTGVRTGDARPGAPFRLWTSRLTWNLVLGTWVAANPGRPIAGDALFTPSANVGGWFSDPTLMTVGNAANESNLSPFVLHDPLVTGNLATAEATLFVMNVIPTTGSDSQYSPYFAPLGTTGTPGAFTSLLPRTGDNRLDPSVRRFSPRAVYVPSAEAAFVMYYGGTAGKNNILYVAAPANANGGVSGPGTQEIGLRLPASVTSASDPMPIVRQVRISQSGGVWRYDPAANPQYVVDVHYTAVLRSGGSADICVSRFRVAGSGTGARLQPIDMPVQTREPLVAISRTPVYRSKHFGWYNRLDTNAPIIEVFDKSGVITLQTAANDWQLDDATKLLFQQLKDGTGAPVPNLLVYVDTSAGVVSFRGARAPSPANTDLVVRATYLPLAYRVAATDAVESSAFGFMDRRPVDTAAAIPNNGAVSNDDGNVLGWYSYGVQTRYNTWNNTGGAGIDRQWLFWQRSATATEPASLFETTRRVGIDLKALGILSATESLKLSPNAGGSVYPLQFVVGVDDVTALRVRVANTDIPFEVDYKKGRIYTQASLEGLEVTVDGQKVVTPGVDPGTGFTAVGTLMPIDEITGGSEGVGRGVPSNRRVNENQPYAFLDLFDGRVVTRGSNPPSGTDLYPVAASDPALQPGRVWMFWSSSQGRSGLARVPDTTFQGYFNVPVGEAITTSGYDLFWQTLAPNFNYPSFSGFP